MKNWTYKSREELEAAGYEFQVRKLCRGEHCRQEIEFWTTPGGKWIPLNMGTFEPHHATCKDVEQSRSGKPQQSAFWWED